MAEDEDPLFNDDWDAAQRLYPASQQRPPATVLAMAVGPNIFFDPSREELAVADVVMSLTFAVLSSTGKNAQAEQKHGVKLLAIRMVEPPGRRLTTVVGTVEGSDDQDEGGGGGVWKKRVGGVGRDVVRRMVDLVVRKGGVGEEVLAGLEGWV